MSDATKVHVEILEYSSSDNPDEGQAQYPEFDVVCDLLIDPDQFFDVPSCGAIAYGSVEALISAGLSEIEEEIESLDVVRDRVDGRWFRDGAGFYHCMNRQNWKRYMTKSVRDRFTPLDNVLQGSGAAKEAFNWTYTGMSDFSFLMLFLQGIRENMKDGECVPFDKVVAALQGRTYRNQYGRHQVVDAGDLPRIAALFTYSGMLVRNEEGRVTGFDFPTQKDFPTKGLLEQCVYLCKYEDPGCCGITLEDLREKLREHGVKAGLDTLEKLVNENLQFFNYFGLIGLKVDMKFLPVPPATTNPSPLLCELVYYHLSLIEEPITLNDLVQNMSGFTYLDLFEETVGVRSRSAIAKILHEAPYVAVVHDDGTTKYFLIPGGVENAMFDALYMHHLWRHRNKPDFQWQGSRVSLGAKYIFWRTRRQAPLKKAQAVAAARSTALDKSRASNTKAKEDDDEERLESSQGTDVDSPRKRRPYRRHLIHRGDPVTFSPSEHREYAARWRALLEEKNTVRLLTKDECTNMLNTRDIARKAPSVAEWRANLVEAWENKFPTPEEGQFMTVGEFMQYLEGRSLPTLTGSSGSIVIENDRSVRIIVREALSLCGCFENFSGKWAYVGTPKEFDESSPSYHSFHDMLVAVLTKLHDQHPDAPGFAMNEIKQMAIGTRYMNRVSSIPVLFTVREGYRFEGVAAKSLHTFPFVRIHDKYSLITRMVKRNENGELPLFNPWDALPINLLTKYAIPAEWIESLPSMPIEGDEVQLIEEPGVNTSSHEVPNQEEEVEEVGLVLDDEEPDIPETSRERESDEMLNENSSFIVLDLNKMKPESEERHSRHKHRRRHQKQPKVLPIETILTEDAQWESPVRVTMPNEQLGTYTVLEDERIPFPSAVHIP